MEQHNPESFVGKSFIYPYKYNMLEFETDENEEPLTDDRGRLIDKLIPHMGTFEIYVKSLTKSKQFVIVDLIWKLDDINSGGENRLKISNHKKKLYRFGLFTGPTHYCICNTGCIDDIETKKRNKNKYPLVSTYYVENLLNDGNAIK